MFYVLSFLNFLDVRFVWMIAVCSLTTSSPIIRVCSVSFKGVTDCEHLTQPC